MLHVTRRRFLQGSAAVGGATLGARYLFGGTEAVVALAEGEAMPNVEDFVNSTCWIGKQECGIRARRIDGRVVKLDGHPDNPRNLGSLCPKGMAQISTLYDPNRITAPLLRTNEKGVPGSWKPISWTEAIELVGQRLNKAQENDPPTGAWVLGRPKVKSIYNAAFTGATGLTGYGRGGHDCAGPSEDAVLATWGVRSVITPDLRHCKLLICYWNLTQAGGPEMCQIALPREVADARKRGMKVVAINPHARSVAHHADEWVPIKPGTDMAFWLAVINVLLAEGFVDEAFLRAHTNAASLAGPDGALVHVDGEELVWDEAAGAAVPASSGATGALLGSFDLDGTSVRPALQVLADHVKDYTPEWSSEECGVPAEQVRRLAVELGETASIGATTVIDGIEVPLRPVAFGLHGTAVKFHDAFQTSRSILLAFMLLGALESAGSAHIADKELEPPEETHEKWLENAAKAKPKRLDLGKSAWFPMGSSGYLMFPVTGTDEERYGLPYKYEDVAVLASYVNGVLSTRPVDKALEAWSRFGFVAMITPYMSETTSYAADVVLPCGTLDKWEGPLGAKTLYMKGDSVRAPLMEPMGESRSEIDILVDVCEAMGKLTGEGGFVAKLNEELKIKDEFLLPLDVKPTAETILDAWSRSKTELSLEELREVGVVSKPVKTEDLYLSIAEEPFHGVRAHFYLDVLPEIGKVMKEAGAPDELSERYTRYPTWTTPIIEQSPADYDLYLMDHKRIEVKQTRSFELPLLAELLPENPVVMNAAVAKRRGFEDGDEVVIESHHPVTGETRTVRTVLRTSNGIRPDTVSLTHHAGRLDQPTVNALIFYGDGMWDISSGWFSHVKVKVTKA